MISIEKALVSDAEQLAPVAVQTLMESHGRSAPQYQMDAYAAGKFTVEALRTELADERNIYYLVYWNGRLAGFSKIILNKPYEGADQNNIALLERIYVLLEFYDQKLGSALFDFNISLMKAEGQAGTWLYVWIENARAIDFYLRKGFVINGSSQFRISDTHSNPTHRMLLLF